MLSGTREFRSAEELNNVTDDVVNRAFIAAKDRTLVELNPLIPIRTGTMAEQFINKVESETKNFTNPGIFNIEISELTNYAPWRCKLLLLWRDVFIKRFDVNFSIQLRLNGMEGY